MTQQIISHGWLVLEENWYPAQRNQNTPINKVYKTNKNCKRDYLLEVFKTDLIIRNLPDLVTKSDLTRFETVPKHLIWN